MECVLWSHRIQLVYEKAMDLTTLRFLVAGGFDHVLSGSHPHGHENPLVRFPVEWIWFNGQGFRTDLRFDI